MKKIKTILRESTGGVFSDAWYDSVSVKIQRAIDRNKIPTLIEPKFEDEFFEEKIIFNERILTSWLFSLRKDPLSSPKRLIIDLKRWCDKNDYRLLKGNSNGKRFVIVFKS